MKYIILIALTLIIPLSGSALTIEQRIEELYKLVYQLQAQIEELRARPATTTPEEVRGIERNPEEDRGIPTIKPQIIEEVKPLPQPVEKEILVIPWFRGIKLPR